MREVAIAGQPSRIEEFAGSWRGHGRHWRRPLSIVQAVVLGALLLWLTVRGAARMGYNWQWYLVPSYFYRIVDGELIWGPLARGFVETCRISAASLVLALVIGLGAALLGRSGSLVGPWLARAYLELVRNTPLLVQLYLFYFVLSPILGVSRWWTGVLCLAAFEGAFAAEIFRAGIAAVPRGQWEAGEALGLSRVVLYRFVILPQALRLMLPPFTNLAVALVKHSAIVSVIALAELTTQGRNIIAETFMSFEIWLTVAGLYLVPTLGLSLLATVLERRLAARA